MPKSTSNYALILIVWDARLVRVGNLWCLVGSFWSHFQKIGFVLVCLGPFGSVWVPFRSCLGPSWLVFGPKHDPRNGHIDELGSP